MKFLFALCTSVLLCVNALALQESDISSFMKSNIDQTTGILKNNQLSRVDKSSKIYALFDPIFDYSLMAKLTLGTPQWNALSPEKQHEFTKLFENRLKASYMEKLELYTDEKIAIKNVEKIKDTRIHLTTHLMKNSDVYEIIYKFYKDSANEWKIYDVDIIGVSIVQTYRTQFADILAKESFEKLIERLKEPESSK